MERPRTDRLDVYYGNELVGTLHDASPIAFEYAPAWLERSERLTVATIPLQPGRNSSSVVQAASSSCRVDKRLSHPPTR